MRLWLSHLSLHYMAKQHSPAFPSVIAQRSYTALGNALGQGLEGHRNEQQQHFTRNEVVITKLVTRFHREEEMRECHQPRQNSNQIVSWQVWVPSGEVEARDGAD